MIFIVGRCCMLTYNDDNVLFTRISCMRNMTCFKMGDGVLTFLSLGLIHISLCLQCHIFVLDGLYFVVTVL